MADAKATVQATVVRGSFMRIKEDGTREAVLPGQGKKSEVTVTEEQLAAFSGTIVRTSEATEEMRRVATESMASGTATDAAIAPPTVEGTQTQTDNTQSPSTRRGR